jgi:hypothetical protein
MPVEVVGALGLRRALSQYAPDLAKELTKELGATLRPIVRDARGFVPSESPMSGWASRSFSEARFPTYNASIIKSGIVFKTSPSQANRAGFVNTVRIQNKSMIGAIYETAGRKNGQGQEWVGAKGGGASKGQSRSNNPYAGNQFISNLGNLYGSMRGNDHRMMGRLIFRAWAKTQGKANLAVIRSIENTTKKFNARTEIVDLRRAA